MKIAMKFLNIEFAPLSIPLERRLQTLGVCFFLLTFLHFSTIFAVIFLIYLLFTPYYWITLLYAIFYYLTFDECEKGGCPSKFIRNLAVWKYFRDYFPIKMVKTSDLDQNKNYIFCVHPHGIMSFGTIANFGTEANNFSKEFPGITPHLLTLKANFCWPVTREYNLLYGVSVASKKTFEWILNNRGKCKSKGQACILVVGGAEESLNSSPGKYLLTLKNRKGFIKIALQTGASIVPVFSFGEIDVYKTIQLEKGTTARIIQDKLKKLTSFALPLAWGRGIFNYTFGILPHRRPITTVVGKPIHIEKIENPTNQQVDELHQRYIQELIDLFNEHKSKYLNDSDTQLLFE